MDSFCVPLSKVDCLLKCACWGQVVKFLRERRRNENFLLHPVAVIEVSNKEKWWAKSFGHDVELSVFFLGWPELGRWQSKHSGAPSRDYVKLDILMRALMNAINSSLRLAVKLLSYTCVYWSIRWAVGHKENCQDGQTNAIYWKLVGPRTKSKLLRSYSKCSIAGEGIIVRYLLRAWIQASTQ